MGTCSEWQLHPISWFHREPLNGRNRRNGVIAVRDLRGRLTALLRPLRLGRWNHRSCPEDANPDLSFAYRTTSKTSMCESVLSGPLRYLDADRNCMAACPSKTL